MKSTLMNSDKLKLALALIAVAMVALSNEARAQDVYNFYFQKSATQPSAPSGVSTSSETAAPSSTPAAAPAPAPAAAAAPAPKPTEATPSASLAATVPPPAKDEYKRWQVNVAYGKSVDYEKDFRGLSFGGDYGINKYFGFQGQIFTGKVMNRYGDRLNDDNTTQFAGSLGVKVTPIHVQLFGWNFIEFAALAGVMSSTGRQAHHEFRFAPYVGGGVTVNFSENVAFVSNVLFDEGESAYGKSTSGLAVRF